MSQKFSLLSRKVLDFALISITPPLLIHTSVFRSGQNCLRNGSSCFMTIFCNNYISRNLLVKGVLWILYAVLKDQSSIKGPALLIHSIQCILGWTSQYCISCSISEFQALIINMLLSLFKTSINVWILA